MNELENIDTSKDAPRVEPKVIVLESLINFTELQWVIINPDNPGIHRPGSVNKALERKGQVRLVYCEHGYNIHNHPTYFPNGKIAVRWEGTTYNRIYNYKNLRIISCP